MQAEGQDRGKPFEATVSAVGGLEIMERISRSWLWQSRVLKSLLVDYLQPEACGVLLPQFRVETLGQSF